MVTINVSNDHLFAQKAQSYALMVEQDFVFPKNIHDALHATVPTLFDIIEQRNFTGKLLQTLSIPFNRPHDEGLAYLVVVGLGKKEDKKKIALENYRRVIGKLMRVQEELKALSMAIALPSSAIFGVTAQELAEQSAEMVHIASYHFDEYITDKDRRVIADREIIFAIGQLDKKEVNAGIKEGEIIGNAVNQARHWIDLPPSRIYPGSLAAHAETIAKEHDLKLTIYNEKEIIALGMGGLASVSRGSDLDCQLVIMEYKAPKKNAPTIALVGKGITFDSGGLSIKPAASMETMKEDMSGAAAVISAMDALGALKPAVNIVALTPISENLPSGKATKPGEIVKFYNGKTAEIKNTDAEGRLILADALSYAVQHYKLDAIIDIATLTGACAHALGPFYCGLMSDSDALVEQINAASARTGDRVWRLPIHDDYKPAIRSVVADICNIGSPKYLAGAITASLFLQNFVGNVPWAHLDIAGTAFDVPDIPYYRPHSATGFGVRLMVDLALHWKS